MTNSASEIIGSVNNGFAGKVTPPTSEPKIHEVDTPTITFRLKGNWPHSFWYSYVRSTRLTAKGLMVKTQDAFITVQGRNLEPLQNQIRRQKIFEIAISSKQANDTGQPFVESISIYYTDEEETHE